MSNTLPIPNTSDVVRAAQADLVTKLGSQRLSAHPFHNPLWTLDSDDVQDEADKLKSSVRICYLSRYLPRTLLTRLVTHVPYICTSGDSYIETQDGRRYNDLSTARKDHPYLISSKERRLGRKKCIVSLSKVLSQGGYKTPLNVLQPHEMFECVIVSGAGAQFEAKYLDYSDFITSPGGLPNRLPEFNHFGRVLPYTPNPPQKTQQVMPEIAKIDGFPIHLHTEGLQTSLTECVYLWFEAFQEIVKLYGNGRKGYFKITAIGSGFFSDVVSTGVNIGHIVMTNLLAAIERVLEKCTFEFIAALEFPDFSSNNIFTPKREQIGDVKLVAAPWVDVLDFSDEVKAEYIVGILNPGDCFACVGNELGYGSVVGVSFDTLDLTKQLQGEHDWR